MTIALLDWVKSTFEKYAPGPQKQANMFEDMEVWIGNKKLDTLAP